MSQGKSIDPVRKTLILNCSIEHAFHVFTDKISVWWPFQHHSCFEDNALEIRIERKVGGKVIEVSKNDEVADWGEVLEWNPPYGFSMSWHPGNSSKLATRLTVGFKSISKLQTEFQLVHEGWEVREDKAPAIRKNYDTGWDEVLEQYLKSSMENSS